MRCVYVGDHEGIGIWDPANDCIVVLMTVTMERYVRGTDFC
jgi:hypothetical protein